MPHHKGFHKKFWVDLTGFQVFIRIVSLSNVYCENYRFLITPKVRNRVGYTGLRVVYV